MKMKILRNFSLRKSAFSLVEILVALIIVSLIVAALAPVITKKLSGSAVTIIGAESNEETPEDEMVEDASTEWLDCSPYNAHYVKLAGHSLCMTKVNVGDSVDEIKGPSLYKSDNTTLIDGVSAVHETNTTACNDGTCCWKGKNGGISTGGTGCGNYSPNDGVNASVYTSNYSSCYRTVCGYNAAKAACENYYVLDPSENWDLPTADELKSLATQLNSEIASTHSSVSKYMGKSGLDLCSNTSKVYWGASKCPVAENCYKTSKDKKCYPYWIWAKSSDGSSAMGLKLSDGDATVEAVSSFNQPLSVRCVLRGLEETEKPGISRPATTWKKPEHQADCSQYGAHFYKPSGSDGMCITKVNAGDSANGITGPNIKNIGVEVLAVKTECITNSCCWQGRTADTYNKQGDDSGLMPGESTYSGQSRTVCTWYAADYICKNYDPDGTRKTLGKWSLPSDEDFAQWKSQITWDKAYSVSKLTRYLGSDGLDLCESTNNAYYGSAYCTNYTNNKCYTSRDATGNTNKSGSMCSPNSLWGSNYDKANFNASRFYITKTTADIAKVPTYKRGRSVRCVLKEVEAGQKNPEKPITDTTNWVTPNSQEDCEPYNAHYYNGTCITKKNRGDDGADMLSLGVEYKTTGVKCFSNSCCWHDGTSATASDTFVGSNYGSQRVVCNWYAAKRLCDSYNPDGKTKGLWELPQKTDFDYWAMGIESDTSSSTAKLTRYLGPNGLDLCEGTASRYYYGCAFCKESGSNKCYHPRDVKTDSNTNGSKCYPYWIWGASITKESEALDEETSSAYVLGLEDYEVNITSANPEKKGRSVRCILRKVEKHADNATVENPDNELTGEVTRDLCENTFKGHYFEVGGSGTCITKGNAGDTLRYANTPSIGTINESNALRTFSSLGIEVLALGTSVYGCRTNVCCWYGQTSSTCTPTGYSDDQHLSVTSEYPGCGRTVCNWFAADKICKYYNPDGKTLGAWSLPSVLELTAWQNDMVAATSYTTSLLSNYLGKEGLDLCDSKGSFYKGSAGCSSSGTNTCYHTADTKTNTNTNGSRCYPYQVWGQLQNDGNPSYFSLVNGVPSLASGNVATRGRSVRCVLRGLPSNYYDN